MARKKLQRFKDLDGLPNVYQTPGALAGNWHADFFKNSNPITLELGCGRGEYTLALAKKYPERNFIGVDLKGSRLWHGARQALDDHMGNVAFLRIFIEKLGEYFGAGEVAEIWIPFPDPYPVYSKRKKRLTSSRFIAIYRTILRNGGLVHLKTDDPSLFRFSVDTATEEGVHILCCAENIDEHPEQDDHWHIRTKFELSHRQKGKIIKYLRFALESKGEP
jgi:tRNA (guanine-N7-)-methyltransferase